MRFAFFVGIVQTILLLGHWFLYRTFRRFLGLRRRSILLAARVAMVVLSVSLLSTSFLSFRYSSLAVRCLYTGAVSWLGIFYLLVLAAILAWCLFGMAQWLHLPLDRKRGFIALLIIALGFTLYGFINSGIIRVTRIRLPLSGLSDSWRGKTAVWVSDTHLGQVRHLGFARRVAAMIQKLRPDIIFIGGDLYDGEAVDLDEVIEPFSRLRAPYGIYFVTGNHEEFFDNRPYLEAVRRAGINVLYNERVELNGLQIIGVGYRDTRRREAFRSVLEQIGIDRSRPSILLKHAPFDVGVAKDLGITLQLSGHTHQGQILLFRFVTSWVYEGFDYGLKRCGDLLVYTSSGAGTWGPPMRVDTKPEIVLLAFE